MPGFVVEPEKTLQEDDPIDEDSDNGEDDADDSDNGEVGSRELTREAQLVMMLDTIKTQLETMLKDIKIEFESFSNKMEMKLDNLERMLAYSAMISQHTFLLLKALAKHMGVDVKEVISQFPVAPSAGAWPDWPTPFHTTVDSVASHGSTSSSPVPPHFAAAVAAALASFGPRAASTLDPAPAFPAPAVTTTTASAVAILTSEIVPPDA